MSTIELTYRIVELVIYDLDKKITVCILSALCHHNLLFTLHVMITGPSVLSGVYVFPNGDKYGK